MSNIIIDATWAPGNPRIYRYERDPEHVLPLVVTSPSDLWRRERGIDSPSITHWFRREQDRQAFKDLFEHPYIGWTCEVPGGKTQTRP